MLVIKKFGFKSGWNINLGVIMLVKYKVTRAKNGKTEKDGKKVIS